MRKIGVLTSSTQRRRASKRRQRMRLRWILFAGLAHIALGLAIAAGVGA